MKNLVLFIWWFSFFLLFTLSTSHDPDEDYDAVQLIISRGYKVEIHYINTKDGYILGTHRIVNKNFKNKTLKPVLLQHGLLSSSIDFINNSPGGGLIHSETADNLFSKNNIGNNLGFVLADVGYDVWLGNSRGNLYSTNHTKLNPKKDKKFWQFTFDQMIEYDLPSSIDYILNITKQKTLAYIGYSQGTMIMFGLLASQPEFSQKIKPYIALAPITTIKYIRSPVKYLAHINFLIKLLKLKGGSFMLNEQALRFIDEYLCESPFKIICADIIFTINGYDVSNLNLTRIQVYASHSPAGTSSWNIVHYAQNIVNGRFSKFDHGPKLNKKLYGTFNPPDYPLGSINSTNIIIFRSPYDWFSDPQDFQKLYNSMKVPLLEDYIITKKPWTHLDFIWAKDAGSLVNTHVVDSLYKYA